MVGVSLRPPIALADVEEAFMGSSKSRSTRSAVLRVLLALTAVSLFVYVPYRYVTRPPEFGGFLGTSYALLFPLSVLLAGLALQAAWRPRVLDRLESAGRGTAGRWGLGVYGGAWVLMGLMCVPSLTALAAHSPVEGLFATIHMTAQHVFLGFGALAVAVDPAVARAVLEGRSATAAWREERSSWPAESPGTG